MSKAKKALLSVFAVFLCLVVSVPSAVYCARGNIKGETVSVEFEESLGIVTEKESGCVRIMSANLLVDYESWGGAPVKPRAKMFVTLLERSLPDVAGLQELSDGWYCALKNNLPDGYKLLYPVSTGVFVRMTAMIYNSKTLEVVDKGQLEYKAGDNPRLRRVVWAVFRQKESGKLFAVANTHFDLVREGKENEELQIMRMQSVELIGLTQKIAEEYNCTVFSVGDFNATEGYPEATQADAEQIYGLLNSKLYDMKYQSDNLYCGDSQSLEKPSYDHIFSASDIRAQSFVLLSDKSFEQMSDHYPIYADIML